MEYREVQGGIAEKFYDVMGGDSEFNREAGFHPCADLADECAEEILSLLFTPKEIEEWKKGGYLAIVCKDQSLPVDKCQEIIDMVGPTREDAGSYKRAQRDMVEDKFVRIVKEE